MEGFSDAIFAIAITLLVLELSVPQGDGDNLLRALADQWPSYVAYLVSFATIGAAWVTHSTMTNRIERADSMLLRLNLVLLLFVGFLPYPTKLVAAHLDSTEAERVATVILGLNLIAVRLMLDAMWRWAIRQRLARPESAAPRPGRFRRHIDPGLAGYVAFIIIGLLAPTIAVFGYLAVSLTMLIPFDLARRNRAG